jgi:hemin uptake protein HemP
MNPNNTGDVSRAAEGGKEPVRIAIQEVLQGRTEVILVHNGEDYRLRVTSRGKLILTK